MIREEKYQDKIEIIETCISCDDLVGRPLEETMKVIQNYVDLYSEAYDRLELHYTEYGGDDFQLIGIRKETNKEYNKRQSEAKIRIARLKKEIEKIEKEVS